MLSAGETTPRTLVTSNQAAQKGQNGTRGDKVFNTSLTAIRRSEGGLPVRREPCERITGRGSFQRLIERGAATWMAAKRVR